MPKTAEQERLEGYPGHRPVNKSAPEPSRDIPDPPKWLGKIGSRHYHDLVRRIGPKGMRVMGASDRDALAMVCDVYEEYRNCREVLEIEGPYFRSKKVVEVDGTDDVVTEYGPWKRHPAVGDKQNAWTRYMTGLGKFGLTPYERQKVSAFEEDKPKQTREEVMAERRKNAVEAAKNKTHIKAVNE